MSVLAVVVEWGNLLQVVWVSIVAGVGITAIWSIGLVGAANFDTCRREGRRRKAAGWAAVALLSAFGCLAAVVQAVLIMYTG